MCFKWALNIQKNKMPLENQAQKELKIVRLIGDHAKLKLNKGQKQGDI